MTISAEGRVTALTLHLLSSDSPESQADYRAFLTRHGGNLTVLKRRGGKVYRLTLPEGTVQQGKQEFGLPLHEGFELVFPDGARLTWFSGIKIDGCETGSVLLTSLEPDEVAHAIKQDKARLRSLR